MLVEKVAGLEMTAIGWCQHQLVEQTVILLRQKMGAMKMHCVSLHKLTGPGESMLLISWNKGHVAKFVYHSRSVHINT